MDTKVADPLRGALLGGRYRIMGRLARGGMATVYQARDERLERPVAIKIIHADHVLDEDLLDRLAAEAKTVARLSHPNIVAVFDQGSHEGAPYVVMEYVRGRTLREVLNDRRRLDPSESLAVLEQLLAALAVAHRAGLVHRDVKPENILVAPPPNGSGDLVDAVVKVADFGLAHAVEVGRNTSGQLLATAADVAPEPVADGRADARPSWARLPGQRGGARMPAHGTVVTPGRAGGSFSDAAQRVAAFMPAQPLQRTGAWLSRTGRRLRDTAQGRRQLTVIVVVLGLLLIGGGWWLGFGRYTTAPGLTDLTKDNAVAEAARLGFSVEYSAGIYSESVPVDTVMKQQPTAGGRVVKGGAITLTLSLGPERYVVPDVAGQLAEFAKNQMPKQIQVQMRDGFSDSLPNGYVVGTEPKANTPLKPNDTVTIIVARGAYPIHLPSVVGTKLTDAEAQLHSAGFTHLDIQHRDPSAAEAPKPKD